MPLILYIDDNPGALLDAMQLTADVFEMELMHVDTALEGLEYINDYAGAIDAVILDLSFPIGQLQGSDVLREIRSKHPLIPVIILTESSNAEDIAKAVQCIHDGAFDYVGKRNLNQIHLFNKVNNAITQADLKRKKNALNDNNDRFLGITTIYEEKGDDQFRILTGLELKRVTLDKKNSQQEYINSITWNNDFINNFTGVYNDRLRIRIRIQGGSGSPLKVKLGFEITHKDKENAKDVFRSLMADFNGLTGRDACSYIFEPLSEDEVIELWNFSEKQTHAQIYRKPFSLYKKNEDGTTKVNPEFGLPIISDTLPPLPWTDSIYDDSPLFEAIRSQSHTCAITVTMAPMALRMNAIKLIREVSKDEHLVPDESIYGGSEIASYYRKLIRSCRNGMLISAVVSGKEPQWFNDLVKATLNTFFGGDVNAAVSIKNHRSAGDCSIIADDSSTALAFHYLPEEALNVVHLPFITPGIPIHLPVTWTHTLITPPNLASSGILMGEKNTLWKTINIYTPPDSLKRHTYILGQTGTGKSTLIRTMALDLINKNEGCCIIDPHGDLFDEIKSRIPTKRLKDIVLFDTADLANSATLNLLNIKSNTTGEKSSIIQELIKSFSLSYDIKVMGGFIFEMFLRSAVLLLLDDKVRSFVKFPTLRHVKRIIQDRTYRNKLLSLTENEDIITSFQEVEAMSGEASWNNFVPYINAKLAVITDNEYLDALFNSTVPSLDFEQLMNQRKILLVRFDKGQIGLNNLNYIGGIFLSQFILAILRRSKIPQDQRLPYYIFIDEFHNFLHRDVAGALAEVRKYNISLVLANQSLGQLDRNMEDAVLGNVGNTIFFRPGLNDFPKIEHYLSPDFTRDEVLKLPNFHCIARLLIDNMPCDPFVFQTKYK